MGGLVAAARCVLCLAVAAGSTHPAINALALFAAIHGLDRYWQHHPQQP